jgi:hypothetical protein
MTIIDAIHDPHLFKPLFKDLSTWSSWLTILKAVFALPMDEEDRALFTTLTGRETPPATQVEECWLVVGRRGGKSFIVALIAAFLACFRDYRPFLGPGERGVIMLVATDRKQARVIMRYLVAILELVPMLREMIERQDADSIDLNNRISIEIMTGSFRTIRGRTVVAFSGEETPFWRSEDSANPAEEILASVRPAMATVPSALLICIGSPYRRSGPMYDAWKRHYGQNDSPILVVQADTRTMNPTVRQSVIDHAMEADPVAAQAEYYAQFRSDVGSFLDRDSIEQAIEPGIRERAPQGDLRYLAFFDAATGERARRDAITLGIAHRERHRLPRSRQEELDQQRQAPRVILDLCRGVAPPFNPVTVIAEFCEVLKAYHCSSVVGDRFAAGFVRDAFNKQGIRYIPSELTKSEVYLECVPLFTTGSVDLLDVPRLTMELMQLERRAARSGRDSVDHGPGGHDDFSNSACGALSLCAQRQAEVRVVKLIGW